MRFPIPRRHRLHDQQRREKALHPDRGTPGGGKTTLDHALGHRLADVICRRIGAAGKLLIGRGVEVRVIAAIVGPGQKSADEQSGGLRTDRTGSARRARAPASRSSAPVSREHAGPTVNVAALQHH